MYICVCNAVNERRIEQAVAEGVNSMKGLCLTTRLGTCCGKCVPEGRKRLQQALAQTPIAVKIHAA